jgi:ATP dependent DNA ligase-like protein
MFRGVTRGPVQDHDVLRRRRSGLTNRPGVQAPVARPSGYTPAGRSFDALLVGYYDGARLIYAASIRNGLTPATRAAVLKRFDKLSVARCPFANLPEAHKGRWGEGLTAADMKKCRWPRPRLVAAIEFLEWTPANHLRHAKFVALREDVKPREVNREHPARRSTYLVRQGDGDQARRRRRPGRGDRQDGRRRLQD